MWVLPGLFGGSGMAMADISWRVEMRHGVFFRFGFWCFYGGVLDGGRGDWFG